MPSYTTKPAFIYNFPNGDFDEETRKHPALRWLEGYLRNTIEQKSKDNAAHTLGHHEDSFIQIGAGKVVRGADDHLNAAVEVYKPFSKFYHTYDDIVVWETSDGWISLGTARLYYTGHDGQQENVQSHDGRSWEGVAPGAYKIHYHRGKNDDDVKLAGVEIYNEQSREFHH